MRSFWTVAFLAGVLVFAPGVSAQTKAGCSTCAQNAAVAAKPAAVPEINAAGPMDSLVPIGVVITLGCETCAAKVVAWALQQGASFEDVDRTLRTIAQVQKLDCFNQNFGPEAVARMEKPLAAAWKTLREAMEHPGK